MGSDENSEGCGVVQIGMKNKVEAGSSVELGIYNLKGQRLAQFSGPVSGICTWSGIQNTAGVYVIRVKAGNEVLTEKIVLRK